MEGSKERERLLRKTVRNKVQIKVFTGRNSSG